MFNVVEHLAKKVMYERERANDVEYTYESRLMFSKFSANYEDMIIRHANRLILINEILVTEA